MMSLLISYVLHADHQARNPCRRFVHLDHMAYVGLSLPLRAGLSALDGEKFSLILRLLAARQAQFF
jgi:hypothetical protein